MKEEIVIGRKQSKVVTISGKQLDKLIRINNIKQAANEFAKIVMANTQDDTSSEIALGAIEDVVRYSAASIEEEGIFSKPRWKNY